ncbi:MAG TPA: hypothetical protein VE988_25895, partial [Gemmataceae bacterium]|nr:hypothetical protein [Gemmataceae bacterium]
MKSFRFYLREPPTHTVPPLRLVTDLSPQEQVNLRESFKPTSLRYRRHGRVTVIIFLAAIGCWLIEMLLPKDHFPWGVGGFFVCVITSMLLVLSPPALVCPGCANRIDYVLGQFCPECGERA